MRDRCTDWSRRRRQAGHPPARDAVSGLALLVAVLAIAVAVSGAHGLVRELLALVFVLFAPGWAVVAWLQLRTLALEVTLTAALGLAIEVLVSMTMLYGRQWHPLSAQAIIAVAVVWSLVLNLAAPPQHESAPDESGRSAAA